MVSLELTPGFDGLPDEDEDESGRYEGSTESPLSFGEVVERTLSDLLSKSEIVDIRSYRLFTRFVYRDGRETILIPKRYPGEPSHISYYDAMQLGRSDLLELSPPRAFPLWGLIGAMGLGLTAGLFRGMRPTKKGSGK